MRVLEFLKIHIRFFVQSFLKIVTLNYLNIFLNNKIPNIPITFHKQNLLRETEYIVMYFEYIIKTEIETLEISSLLLLSFLNIC